LLEKNKIAKPQTNADEKGLTLIECLVAIAVIAATIGVIAPVTVLAVATRVQNQRAAQASLIAQSEVDRIRLLVERGGDYTAKLDELVAVATQTDVDDVPSPDTAEALPTTPSVGIARYVRGDEDFSVQSFRITNPDGVTADGLPVAFELGVRVYRTKTIDELDPADMLEDPISLAMTSGEGQAGSRPMAVLYTTIMKSDDKESLCDYYRYVDSTATIPDSCT